MRVAANFKDWRGTEWPLVRVLQPNENAGIGRFSKNHLFYLVQRAVKEYAFCADGYSSMDCVYKNENGNQKKRDAAFRQSGACVPMVLEGYDFE